MHSRAAARPASLALRLACAFAGALAQVAAFAAAPAGPWPGWPAPGWLPGLLQWLGVVALVAALPPARAPGRPAWRAAAAGWLFGAAWLAGSVWWLYVSMHRYGGLPAPLAAAAVALLAGALALYPALACAAFVRLRAGTPGRDAALFAALWLLAELARGRWFTGFPWAAAGYAHVDGPLAGWAPWVGVYGIGALGAGAAVLLVHALAPRRAAPAVAQGDAPAPRTAPARMACLAALLVLAGLPRLLPGDFTRSAGAFSVTLLQGNVAQDEKFDPRLLPEDLQWHLQALRAARTDLVVAAETAVPLLPEQMPPGLWDDLLHTFDRGRTHALFGVPLGDAGTGYTNSAVGVGPGAAPYRYDKHHLVPFGEFIPAGFRWFVAMMNIPLGDFDRGPLRAPSMPLGAQRIAPNICYEDLFGEELAARFADAAAAPTVLANLSNIGWFGQTVAVSQHLQISRMRTLELQRPMLRATNTGATVVIDHRGRVQAALAPFTRGPLVAQVQGREGLTPFAWWAARWGTGPLWLVAALAMLPALAARWRRARRS